MNLRKILLWIAVLLAACIIFLYAFRFPHAVNVTYPAVEYRADDPSSAAFEKTTLHIKGTLYKPLFRDKKFKGTVWIEKYAFTKLGLFPVVFHRDILNGWGVLTYITVQNNSQGHADVAMQTLGDIHELGDLAKIKISVYEPVLESSKHATGLTIAAPAQTLEEAKAIVKLWNTDEAAQ